MPSEGLMTKFFWIPQKDPECDEFVYARITIEVPWADVVPKLWEGPKFRLELKKAVTEFILTTKAGKAHWDEVHNFDVGDLHKFMNNEDLKRILQNRCIENMEVDIFPNDNAVWEEKWNFYDSLVTDVFLVIENIMPRKKRKKRKKTRASKPS